MDNQILRNLFRNCIEAAEVLKTDADFAKRVKQAMDKLPPHKIGQFGQLQEWLYDFKEMQVGHRHISHLFASYPDDDITIRKTPELAKAVKVVLQRRGNINKGWSGAWKINQHARLGDSEEAYEILKSMLTDISIHPREEDSEITPSFEGNQGIQGVTAGVAELLMQSHSNEIYLLPALPKAWSEGKIYGLRGRGGYTVDLNWKNQVASEGYAG
jgi:alpha-L-fucosidase 2